MHTKNEKVLDQLQKQNPQASSFLDDFETIEKVGQQADLQKKAEDQKRYEEQQKQSKKTVEVDDFEMIDGEVQKETTTHKETKKVGITPSEMGVYNKSYYRNSVYLKERMSRDTAKLGSKVWKPNEAEKEKNQRIDKAKQLTKNATGYTLSISESILKETRDIQKAVMTDYEKSISKYTQELGKVHFTTKMFSSAYINKHFSECYRYICYWQKLSDVTAADMTEETDSLLKQLSEVMPLFKKRIQDYCAKNRIDFNTGEGLSGKYRPTEAEKISDEDVQDWLSATSSLKEKRVGERQRATLSEEFSTEPLSEEAIHFAEEEPQKVDYEEVEEMTNYLERYRSGNLQDLPKIKGTMNAIREQLEKADTEIARNDLRKELMEYRALERYVETELEIEKLRIKHPGLTPETLSKEHPELCRRLYDTREDIRKIEKRKDGHTPFTEEGTTSEKIVKLSREKALSTESDRLSTEGRTALLKEVKRLRKIENPDEETKAVLDELSPLIKAYYDKNFYLVGDRKEAKAMKEILRCLDRNKDRMTKELEPLFGLIKKTTDGNLDFDPAAPLQTGSVYMDKTVGGKDETRPKTTEDHTTVWWAKALNGTYKALTKWEDRRDEPLFAHEPTVNDLRQGKVSNCWMVTATTAAINLNPEIIKNCMKDNGDGTVTVRLYTRKQDPTDRFYFSAPVYIRVKKETPKLITGGAVHTSGALWMQMLEKAAAFIGYKEPGKQDEKLGYNALWHGSQGDWIFALTGIYQEQIASMDRMSHTLSPSDKLASNGSLPGYSKVSGMGDADLIHDENFKNEVFNDILHAKENGYAYLYGTASSNVEGMNSGHAYTVLGAELLDGKPYIRLRNPYANMNSEYTEKGKIYRTDSFLKSEMNETFGQFFITLEDFVKNAGQISRVRLTDKPKTYEIARSEHEKEKDW